MVKLLRWPWLFFATLALVFPGLWAALAPLAAQPVVINEFLAANHGPLVDEDGDSSDWIELQNAGAVDLNLEGYFLTDDRSDLARWSFPRVTLPAGGYLLVFASGKSRASEGKELHTSFKLESSGEYLALIQPDGKTVVDELAPSFPRQRDGVSFGRGEEALPAPLVAAGARARVHIPADDTLGLTWTGGAAHEPFDDSEGAGWLEGPTGAGFETRGNGRPPIGYWSFDDALDPVFALDSSGNERHGFITSHLALTGRGGSRRPVYTTGGRGHTGSAGDRALDFGPTGSGGLVRIEAALDGMFDSATARDAVTLSLWILGGPEQPADGLIFWGSSNSDGTGIRSLNAHTPWSDSTIYWDTSGCCDGTQRISKPESDSTRWKGKWNHYVFVKRGDRKEIWQNGSLFQEGTNTANLTLVRGFFIGGPLNQGNWSYGGLIDDFAVWDEALRADEIRSLALGASPLELSSFGHSIATDIKAAMLDKSASAYLRIPFSLAPGLDFDSLLLRVQYNDGFVAYLNGVEVSRRNAPSETRFHSRALSVRPLEKALVFEEIGFTAPPGLLRTGGNILAIQGLNASAESGEFLILPELRAVKTSARRYFPTPTPGGLNGAGFSGFVADTSFSVDRGFFTSPFDVEISTATEGAAIYYSTNGNEPGPGVLGSALYQGPIRIATTTTLRAAAFKDGFQPTNTDTQTYIFPAEVKKQPARPAGLPATWSGGFAADYAVDSKVVSTTLLGYSLEEALLSIPALSLTLKRDDLFGAPAGIYFNSQLEGERPASVELIDPRGRKGFQVNAGARIHGYTSRDKNFTPKHSFRIHFKGRFGPTKLDHPLYLDSSLERFDQLHLRGMSTDSFPVMDGWPGPGPEPLRWYREKSQYIRDQWMKDSQRDMGQPACHGVYVHLFLNGLYWGLYDVMERPTDSFQAGHSGGEREEYDVLKDFAEVQSGNGQAWSEMMALAQAGLASAAYQRIQGNNPDGTRNPAFEKYLDLDNLIDYMILHIYAGADDWPDHNWWAGRRRGLESEGFRFFSWDQEITNNSLRRTNTSWGTRFEDVSAYNSPAYLYSQLRASAEFRLRFADRVHRHLFNGGALTPEENDRRWMARASEIDQAIVGESARWGDHRRAVPYKREVEWLKEQKWLRETYWKGVHPIALGRFKRVGLYPPLAAPLFSQHGGRIGPGFELSMTAPAGAIRYTLDGSDPRRAGGAAAPGALTYAASIRLDGTTWVKARALQGVRWSALTEAFFGVEIPLRITEIHYHPEDPPDAGRFSGDDFEFLEVKNIGTASLDLAGIRLEGAVEFDFKESLVKTMPAGGIAVLVKNYEAFRERYDEARISTAGLYRGELRNSGERILLLGPRGEVINNFRYADFWYPETDGGGRSLVILDAAADPASWGAKESWRPSLALGGTPGRDEAPVPLEGGLQLRADLNQDSALNISDAVGLLFLLFVGGSVPPPCEGPVSDGGNRELLDANGDAEIGLSDSVHILSYLFLGGPAGPLGGACVRIPGCPEACRRE